jgi:hypothetical protein
VHAGKNVCLQNAGHKQTGYYLSLKVSVQNRRLDEKEKVVSDVFRMKRRESVGLHRGGNSQKCHRSTTSHLPPTLRLLTQDHFLSISLLSVSLSVRRNVVQPRDEFCYEEAFLSCWCRSEGTKHGYSSTQLEEATRITPPSIFPAAWLIP